MLLLDSDTMKEPSNLTQLYYLGIYSSAMKLNVADKDAVMQYVYHGYREQHNLSRQLRMCWPDLTRSVGYDPYYKGMLGGKLDYEIDGALALDFCNEHPALMAEVRRWGHVLQMINFLNLDKSLTARIIDTLETHCLIEKYKESPYVAIDSELMGNIWNRRFFLFDDEWATLAMQLGICSKIGTKPFAMTTRVEILCRMFGCTTQQELDETLSADPVLQEKYEFYSTRRRYERLMRKIIEVYHLREVGLKRRTYVSFRFKNDRDFITAIAAQDAKLQESRRKKEQQLLIKELFV